MSTSSNDSGTSPQPPDRSTVILLLADIADTTWRMFVPTLCCIGLGFWGDNSWGTKPWLTILGIIAGTAVTTLLIRKQFKNVRNTK